VEGILGTPVYGRLQTLPVNKLGWKGLLKKQSRLFKTLENYNSIKFFLIGP
jgi:hypothetical protein